MEKIEIFRLIAEVAGFALLTFFAAKTFKYKDSLTAIIKAAKDLRVTEKEFQEIVDAIKKDIYG
jgi:hypothetical protein